MIKVVTTYSMPGQRVLLLAASPDMDRAARRVAPYAGLLEAAWSVVRLGRGVQTAQVARYEGRSGSEADCRLGLFDVIITAAEPRTLASVRPTTWSRVLAPGGVFAVISQSGHSGAGLHGPSGGLVCAACEDGLRYLDQITLLRVPIDRVLGGDVGDPNAVSTRVRVHADLHVFAHPRDPGTAVVRDGLN